MLDLKSPNLCVVFTVRGLTLALNNPLIPVTFARTSVVRLLYPIPELIITVSVNAPLVITGLTIAPVPPPVEEMINSGAELNSLP